MTIIISWVKVIPSPVAGGKVKDQTTFQWLGTAGFRICHQGTVLLIDPYLDSRGEQARPVQPLRARDMADASKVFLTHGHFDHIADVPAVVEGSGADVYCSAVAAETLERRGVAPSKIERLEGGEALDFGSFQVRTFTSEHIVFDARLIMRTVPRVLKNFDRDLLKQISGMPPGPVLIYWFDFGGLSVVHMGSLGLVPEEAVQMGIVGPDIFMPPLQGHSHICSMAARLTAAVHPRAVLPQHQDDFFPPVSQSVELLPFKAMVAKLLPECAYYEPEINREFTASEILGTSN